MGKYYSIAIDGPAGAGKSTIAKLLAKELNFIYVDTGAMYRAFALYYIRNNINIDDEVQLDRYCSNIDVKIKHIDGEQIVLLNGINVNPFIRTEEVSKATSKISTNKNVRMKLVQLQRQLANETNVVMDGRDIGSFVLPNANLKIYLSATVSERAKRRLIQLNDNEKYNLDLIEKEISERDYRDMHRDFAPLCKANNAIEIDTSNFTIEQVIDKIIKLYKEK